MKRLLLALALFVALTGLTAAPPAFGGDALMDSMPIDNINVKEVWIDAKGLVTYMNENGKMVTQEFIRYRDLQFTNKPRKLGHLMCIFQEIDTQVSVGDIKRVLNVPAEKKATITRNDGSVFNVALERDLGVSLSGMTMIQISYFNELTKQHEFGYISGLKIRELVFTEPVVVN